MIKKLLKQGLNKTEIARRLGISRETVRKYSNLPDDYIPVIHKTPVENIVDPFLPHIAKMLKPQKRRTLLFRQLSFMQRYSV